MNRPSFFIAGNSKSGTTALYHFLQQHPALFLSDPKEPNYFAKDFCRDPDPDGYFHPRSEAAYLALFEAAAPGQLCGEASACYLYSSVAAAAIHHFAPASKLIFILREPVSFLHSYHQQLLKNPISEGEAVMDFEEALALEPARKAGRALPAGCLIPEMLFYRDRIRYAEQLARYFERFPEEQVLVLFYEDFRADNAATYRRVLAFLGVDAEFEPLFAQHNKGADLRSKRMQHWLRQVTFGESWAAPLKPIIKAVLPQTLRKRAVQELEKKVVYRPRQAVDVALAAQLRQEFRPEVERLSQLLGVDLITRWGYERA